MYNYLFWNMCIFCNAYDLLIRERFYKRVRFLNVTFFKAYDFWKAYVNCYAYVFLNAFFFCNAYVFCKAYFIKDYGLKHVGATKCINVIKNVRFYNIERITKKARVSKKVRLHKNRYFYIIIIVSKNVGVMKSMCFKK